MAEPELTDAARLAVEEERLVHLLRHQINLERREYRRLELYRAVDSDLAVDQPTSLFYGASDLEIAATRNSDILDIRKESASRN